MRTPINLNIWNKSAETARHDIAMGKPERAIWEIESVLSLGGNAFPKSHCKWITDHLDEVDEWIHRYGFHPIIGEKERTLYLVNPWTLERINPNKGQAQ